MGTRERVALVDVSALAHAAWHGYPERLGPDGQCYRVLHGVLSKLHRLHRSYEWERMVAVMDPPGGSLFRKSIFPDYKAHRPPEDADFARQRALLDRTFAEFGIRSAMLWGVESDDLIGSLAKKESDDGNWVMIVSPDKDFAQLVSESVWLVQPSRGEKALSTPFETLDRYGILERYGIWPEQVADWLALIGDVSDNIPGVEKVGPKTAAKWLEKYGDLHTLLTRAEEIGGVAGENLRQAREILPTIQKLTRIQIDLEIPAEMRSKANFCEKRAAEAQKAFGMPSWMGFFDEAFDKGDPGA